MSLEFDPSSVVKSQLLAGLLGSLVALRGVPGASAGERWFNAFAGTVVSYYTSPAVAEWFGLGSPAMTSAVAFVVGLFGLNVIAVVVPWIRTLDLGAIIPFGKKGQ